MTGFRDMTFCRATDCLHFGPCSRSLTDDVRRAAEQWWGGPGALIWQQARFDECFEPRPDSEKATT